MLLYYATCITVDETGAYRSEFIVGDESTFNYYSALIDPLPDQWNPAPFGINLGDGFGQ